MQLKLGSVVTISIPWVGVYRPHSRWRPWGIGGRIRHQRQIYEPCAGPLVSHPRPLHKESKLD